MTWPAVVENICILAFIALMVWLTGSGRWALVLILVNMPHKPK